MGGFGGFDDYDLSNGSRNAIVIVCPKSTCLIICVKRQKLKSESEKSMYARCNIAFAIFV